MKIYKFFFLTSSMNLFFCTRCCVTDGKSTGLRFISRFLCTTSHRHEFLNHQYIFMCNVIGNLCCDCNECGLSAAESRELYLNL